MLDSVISVVSRRAAHVDFEAVQLTLAEHIRMLIEHSKFSNRNVLATYAARGNRSGNVDCRRGGRNDGGGRDGGASMLNGEWDNSGISNGDDNFAVYKLNNIEKCWYPVPEY